MSTSPQQRRNRTAPGVANGEQGGEVSRRAMLAGAAATTAVAAVGAGDIPHTPAPQTRIQARIWWPSWCFPRRSREFG